MANPTIVNTNIKLYTTTEVIRLHNQYNHLRAAQVLNQVTFEQWLTKLENEETKKTSPK